MYENCLKNIDEGGKKYVLSIMEYKFIYITIS